MLQTTWNTLLLSRKSKKPDADATGVLVKKDASAVMVALSDGGDTDDVDGLRMLQKHSAQSLEL